MIFSHSKRNSPFVRKGGNRWGGPLKSNNFFSFFDKLLLTYDKLSAIVGVHCRRYEAYPIPGQAFRRCGKKADMNWNNSKSILLSEIGLAVFAAALLFLDVFLNPLLDWYMELRLMTSPTIKTGMMVTVYAGSIFAWVILVEMFLLLLNLKKSEIFTTRNVNILRNVSIAFLLIAMISVAGGFFYLPFFIVAVSSAFLMLIVRIVKNAFAEAERMKNELDLTI